MAVLPPRAVPVVDPRTGRMDQRWYSYFFERDLENQPERTSSYLEFEEMIPPSTPDDGKARVFASDAGAGKTQLSVLFPDGVVQQIKVEP